MMFESNSVVSGYAKIFIFIHFFQLLFNDCPVNITYHRAKSYSLITKRHKRDLAYSKWQPVNL